MNGKERKGNKMKKLILSLLLAGIVSFAYSQSEYIEKIENLNLGIQYESGNRTVRNFKNSLTDKKYLQSFKEITLFLWNMNDYIIKHTDSSGDDYSYKMNNVFACNTAFVNNELLVSSPLKIGMSKNDVYELFGHPERSIAENKSEFIDYSKSFYMPDHYNAGENFYASVGLELFFDENKVVEKIILSVEDIPEPLRNSFYRE